MEKAYDTLLETEIKAINVDSIDDDRYRFECSCCGEQVVLAAKKSSKMIPHFRHFKNNNNTECELYISLNDYLVSGSGNRKSKKEIFDIFYDSYSEQFKIGIKYDEESLEWSENEKVELEIKDNSKIIIKSIKVTRQSFFPEEYNYIFLKKPYPRLYINNSKYGEREIDFIDINKPIFFKIVSGDVSKYFLAKKNRRSEIYSNVQYIVVCNSGLTFVDQLKKTDSVKMEQIKEFNGQYGERSYCVYLVMFNEINDGVKEVLENWGYRISRKESLEILWPPVMRKIENFYTNKDYVYVYSSFELKPHSNINVNDEDLFLLDNYLYRIRLNENIKIFNKNTELSIKKENIDLQAENNVPLLEERVNYCSNNNYTCLLLNKYGTKKLQNNEKIIISRNTKVFETSNSYVNKIINPVKNNCKLGKELLDEILQNYHVEIPFDGIDVNIDDLDIKDYADNCRISGFINKAVYERIVEGKI